MARPETHKTKCKNLKEALEMAMRAKGLEGEPYSGKIEQYMQFYDDLSYINARKTAIKRGDATSDRALTDLSSEARLIDKRMEEILNFLGLKPAEGAASASVPL